ncbi:MAG: hypothetical protein SWE60_10115 [Thermodesulfobacteriota bacterium]|nr:hypothetical protein [Thermodesulfobacteriota bacterium]
MAKQRCVDKLLAVFDLNSCQAFGVPEGASTQVMFQYDRQSDIKEFSLLGNEMPKDMNSRITAWLNENIGVDEVVHCLGAKQVSPDDSPQW